MDWEAESERFSRLFVPRDDKARSFSTSTPFLHESSQECKNVRSVSVSAFAVTSNDSGLGASWTETGISSFVDFSQNCGVSTVSVCQTPSFSVNIRQRHYEGRKLDLSSSPISRRSYLARSLDSDFSFSNQDDSNTTLNSSANHSFARKLDLDIDIDGECESLPKNCQKTDKVYQVSEQSTPGFQELQLVSQFNEMLEKFSPIESDRLIGRKMGRGKVDILSELNARNIDCITQILTYLDAEDLCSLCMVSKDWKSLCESNSKANTRRKKFIKQKKKHSREYGKENFGKKPLTPISRVVTESSVLQSLGTVQLVGDNLLQLHSGRSKTTADHFIEAAKSLVNEEILQKCPRCRKPAKVHPVEERGRCQNTDCGYDYCVKCLYDFHGSKDCVPIAKKRTKTDAIGTKKSKKNLKRL